MKYKDNGYAVVIQDKYGDDLYTGKTKISCLQVLHGKELKNRNAHVYFTIYRDEISLKVEEINKYLDVLQNKIGLEFEYEESDSMWNFHLDYSKYSSARYGYVIMIFIRYIYIGYDCGRLIQRIFELKERTKYTWIKCLQLAHIWKQGNYGHTLYIPKKYPFQLLTLDEFKKYLVDGNKGINAILTSSNEIVHTELKDIIKEYKKQETSIEDNFLAEESIKTKKLNVEAINKYIARYGYKLSKEQPKDQYPKVGLFGFVVSTRFWDFVEITSKYNSTSYGCTDRDKNTPSNYYLTNNLNPNHFIIACEKL